MLPPVAIERQLGSGGTERSARPTLQNSGCIVGNDQSADSIGEYIFHCIAVATVELENISRIGIHSRRVPVLWFTVFLVNGTGPAVYVVDLCSGSKITVVKWILYGR